METEFSEGVEVDALANVHSHLREGDVVGPLIERAIEGGADVLLPMPNTNKGLTSPEEVMEYCRMVQSLVPEGAEMQVIPTMMVTEQTTFGDIDDMADAGIKDVKVYPLNRTTKSHNGVRHYGKLLNGVLKRCGRRKVKIHFHPEHPSMTFSNRDAEFAFLAIADMALNETETVVIWEHGTDSRCIPHWKDMAMSGRFHVTLTAHHLASNEDATFGDVRAVCKPPIKTEQDRLDLIRFVEEDNEWVMAGPDDAPHDVNAKHVHEGKCACGAYTSPFLLPLYAHALEIMLETEAGIAGFVNFTSRNARRFHGLPGASRKIRLVRKPFMIPNSYAVGPWTVEPFWANTMIDWKIA